MIILAPLELFASINIALLDIVELVSKEKVLEVSFIFPALRVVPLIFPKVTPFLIVEVESVFAPIVAASTCPLPAPVKVPFAFIVIPLFVKVLILVRPVPPFDAGNCPVPSKLPSSSMAPATIFAAVIVFADSLSASILPVVIFPPSIVVVFALIIVAGSYPVIAPLLPLVNVTSPLNPIPC